LILGISPFIYKLGKTLKKFNLVAHTFGTGEVVSIEPLNNPD